VKKELEGLYDSSEAGQIAHMIFEDAFQFSRTDVFLNKAMNVSAKQQAKVEGLLAGLKSGMPVQYALGYAWFAGMKLLVDRNVLIPRGETEELVSWVSKSGFTPGSIIDVGTGSGCIALSMKKSFTHSKVYAIDLSQQALILAARNAEMQALSINFLQHDALNLALDLKVDLVISNPPYVREQEAADMKSHVKNFEPGLALFVPDDDPLVYYRNITKWAYNNLNPGGWIYYEINESMSERISELHSHSGFESQEIRKDLNGKFRFFRARRSHE